VANSKRKTILDYLVATTLAQITTGGGYNFTVQTLARGFQEIDSMPDSKFPAVFVGRADEERDNITVNQFKARMQTVIVGYVKNSGGVNGTLAQLDNLIEDITKALETDRKLGGNAKWLEIKSVKTDDGDYAPLAACAIIVEIVYVTEGVTP
jgi:hypothetical protein